MNSYESILQKLHQEKDRPKNSSCHDVLQEMIKLFEALEAKKIKAHEFEELITELQTRLRHPELKLKQLLSLKSRFLMTLSKNHNIVTPKHYQNMWLAIGMAAFGLPIGFLFAIAIDNFAFSSIGLPIGMPIGIAIGARLDKKAEAEGRVIHLK